MKSNQREGQIFSILIFVSLFYVFVLLHLLIGFFFLLFFPNSILFDEFLSRSLRSVFGTSTVLKCTAKIKIQFWGQANLLQYCSRRQFFPNFLLLFLFSIPFNRRPIFGYFAWNTQPHESFPILWFFSITHILVNATRAILFIAQFVDWKYMDVFLTSFTIIIWAKFKFNGIVWSIRAIYLK